VKTRGGSVGLPRLILGPGSPAGTLAVLHRDYISPRLAGMTLRGGGRLAEQFRTTPCMRHHLKRHGRIGGHPRAYR
jgi:hypothetical protein